MALLNLFMINHRHFLDSKFGPVCIEKFSLTKRSNLIVFFSLNMSLERVFRVEGEIGFAYENYFAILGVHTSKKLKIDQLWSL